MLSSVLELKVKKEHSVGEATTGIWIFLRLLPQKRGDTIRWLAGYVADKAYLNAIYMPCDAKA